MHIPAHFNVDSSSLYRGGCRNGCFADQYTVVPVAECCDSVGPHGAGSCVHASVSDLQWICREACFPVIATSRPEIELNGTGRTREDNPANCAVRNVNARSVAPHYWSAGAHEMRFGSGAILGSRNRIRAGDCMGLTGVRIHGSHRETVEYVK
jgi:hypothetical protein